MALCVPKARAKFDGCGPLTNYKQPSRWQLLLVTILLLVLLPGHTEGNAVSPKIEPVHHRWSRSEAMDPNGLYTLDWHIDQKDIVFTATANTRGFMGLGFSHRSEHMAGSDLVLVWVDDRTGKPNVLFVTSFSASPVRTKCNQFRHGAHECGTRHGGLCRDSGSGRGTQVEPAVKRTG
uniref:DOMON domain-containing protein n=1 Tax=Anopheles minimus TaxID=112268 RepID=A0A182WF51_9DIPT